MGFGGAINVLDRAKFHRLMVTKIKRWGITHTNRRWMQYIATVGS